MGPLELQIDLAYETNRETSSNLHEGPPKILENFKLPLLCSFYLFSCVLGTLGRSLLLLEVLNHMLREEKCQKIIRNSGSY